MALYNDPSTQIRINGQLSSPFPIYNGTRQGCPLSPLLYVLFMEPLVVTLRRKADVKGIRMGSDQLALYADDLLLYISSPSTTLPIMLQECNKFGELSNFKVNTHKSEILNVTLPREVVDTLRTSFPIEMANTLY